MHPEHEQPQQNCWNDIGVWGRSLPRCEKLEEVSHCRNCLVYIRAGRRKLDGLVPDDYDIDWAQTWMQAEDSEEATGKGDLSLLVFRLHDEYFALPVAQVHEVLPVRQPSPLPHRNPDVLLGLMQVRGELCLHISLGGLLGMPRIDLDTTNGNPLLLHVRPCGHPVVFAVHEVSGVHYCYRHALQPVPDSLPVLQRRLSLGLCMTEVGQGRHHACVLDTDRWSDLGELIR